jgi:hypothetical protein
VLVVEQGRWGGEVEAEVGGHGEQGCWSVGGSGGGGGGGSGRREVRVVAASLRRGWEEETEDAVLDQCAAGGRARLHHQHRLHSPLTRCVQQTRTPEGQRNSCKLKYLASPQVVKCHFQQS